MLTAVLRRSGGPDSGGLCGVLGRCWSSGVAQAGLCWWAVRKAGANIRFRMPRLTPEVKAIIITAVPGA